MDMTQFTYTLLAEITPKLIFRNINWIAKRIYNDSLILMKWEPPILLLDVNIPYILKLVHIVDKPPIGNHLLLKLLIRRFFLKRQG